MTKQEFDKLSTLDKTKYMVTVLGGEIPADAARIAATSAGAVASGVKAGVQAGSLNKGLEAFGDAGIGGIKAVGDNPIFDLNASSGATPGSVAYPDWFKRAVADPVLSQVILEHTTNAFKKIVGKKVR